MSVNSPTPNTMPPPNNKRPRQSAGANTNASSATVSGPSTTGSRVKRRKNDVDDGVDGSDAGRGRSSGTSKGKDKDKDKDDDSAEGSEGQTKIDFRTLPEATLYKYLEYHDLMPRWEVSPWSEELSIAPHELYKSAPATNGNTHIDEAHHRSPLPPTKPDLDSAGPSGHTTEAGLDGNRSTAAGADDDIDVDGPQNPDDPSEAPEEDTTHPRGAPTTRSRTAPRRSAGNTHSRSPVPRKVDPIITLSDINTAREVLADRANAHWQKGLGGGQNKEGETIVNFLYKLKVGSGRLLKVYNPPPTAQ